MTNQPPGVRRPQLGIDGGVQVVSPGVRSLPGTMPAVSQNARDLALWLGVVDNFGAAFSRYTDNELKSRRMRQGMASDFGKQSAESLAQQFDNNLIDDPALLAAASGQGGDIRMAPAMVNDTVRRLAEQAADNFVAGGGNFRDDMERTAFIEGYQGRLQSSAKQWTKGIVDGVREDYSVSMSASLRYRELVPGDLLAAVRDTRLEWMNNPLTAGLSESDFTEMVVVPAMKVLLDEGLFHQAINIANSIEPRNVTPAMASLLTKAKDQQLGNAMELFRQRVGESVYGARQDSDWRSDAIDLFREIVQLGDNNDAIVGAVRSTIREVFSQSHMSGVDIANTLLAERDALFLGSRVRNAIHEELQRAITSPGGGESETDRANRAKGMMMQHHAAGFILMDDGRVIETENIDSLRRALMEEFGPNHGLRLFISHNNEMKDKVRGALSMQVTPDESRHMRASLNGDMSRAMTTAELQDVYSQVMELFNGNKLMSEDYQSLTANFLDMRAKIPFKWETNEVTRRVNSLMSFAYSGVSGDMVSNILFQTRDAEAVAAFEALRLDAMAHWDAFVAQQIYGTVNEPRPRMQFDLRQIEAIGREWEQLHGTNYIRRAGEIATAAGRRKDQQNRSGGPGPRTP